VHTLKVRMLADDGEAMPEEERRSLYVADLHFGPVRRSSVLAGDGSVEIQTPDWPVALHAHVTVPGFGALWVMADNGGEGYGPSDADIDFVTEAASSRIAEVERLMSAATAEFSVECRAHVAAAADYQESAHKATGGSRAELLMRSLAHGLWAGEMALVESARARIAENDGCERTLFGCNAFGRGMKKAGVRGLYSRAFEFATLPFYLAALEREEGKPDYGRVDEILAWCEGQGIVPKGHPLWWGHAAGTPPWLEGADWAAAQRHCRRVVLRSVERYRGRIGIWDAINEAHDWANGLSLTQQQEVEITRIACDAVREANPDATVIVNNCLPFGENAATGQVNNGPVHEPMFTPLRYLDAVMEAGVDFDVIGVQLYFPARDMLAVSRLLDEYARFGKPVHITEMGVSSGRRSRSAEGETPQTVFTRGQWHAPWSERVQADWLEWFYTIACSRPDVEALTWWDFCDPAFIPSGGLICEDGTPKEAYHRLLSLAAR